MSSSLPSPGPSTLPYRPFWQLVFLGTSIAFAGYLGTHVLGQPWHAPGLAPFLVALVVAGACLLFRVLDLSPSFAPLLKKVENASVRYSSRQRFFWPCLGFLGVATALLILEKAHPFYFSQDDNLHANLPVLLQGCRSFFAGHFPLWNPYQYMGSPTTSLGYYAFTYPLTFASYWFAWRILGNPNAMIDVLVATHLLLGYFAFYWIARRERCRPSVSMLAASCYTLSGYALIFSRSFEQFSGILLWAPLLVACIQELRDAHPSWKWILAFGACTGFLFHAGHIQMWAYTMLLANIAMLILLMTGSIRPRAFVSGLAANLVGLAFAAPFLVPELLAAHDATRYRDDSGILVGLKSVLLPDALSPSPHPTAWGVCYPIGEMYYSGILFPLLAAAMLLSLLATRWGKSAFRENLWFVLALIAFLLALGNPGILWIALSHLPGFDRFRFPFKFLGLFDLFVILAGAVILERLLHYKNWVLRTEILLAVGIWISLAYHCALSTAAFSVYPFTPYPVPDPEITRRLLPDGVRYYPKVLPVETLPDGLLSVMPGSGNRSTDPAFLDSYMNQWPTLAGVFSLSGDDPLVRESPAVQKMARNLVQATQPAMSAYGVKFLLQYFPPGIRADGPLVAWPGARLVYASANVRLFEMASVRPMAFPEEDPQHALPAQFDVAGATLDTSELPQGATVILNMLWRSEFRAIANGSGLPVEADALGRIRIVVPANASSVRVQFRPQWERGFFAAGVLLFLGLALARYALQSQATEHHHVA
jgi:hypothetical protein